MNSEKPDANWWLFSIAASTRGEKIKDDPAAGTVEINPEIDGKKLLSYHRYLRLDRLLGSQGPGSLAPEERIFIITHQLFELVFKQTIFDLRVIADTFPILLQLDRESFSRLSQIGDSVGNPQVEDFWRPASTAASRVRHSCQRVLPAIMAYLALEENFNNQEFANNFRDNLSPASGFQSAQFRLIQRAFGKSNLLDIRLFPGDTYLKYYLGFTETEVMRAKLESESAGLVKVTDPLILQEDAPVASPPAGSPLFPVAGLDDLAHQVLARIAALEDGKGAISPTCGVPRLPAGASALDNLAITFKEGMQDVLAKIKKAANQPQALSLEELAIAEKRAQVLRADWATAVARENRRRESFGSACLGAGLLLESGREGYLFKILDNLREADDALSGRFLLFHRQMVERRVGEVPGTAGGGVPFLDFSRHLLDRFPALIALRTAREKMH